MSGIITESEIEEHALNLLQNIGYDYMHGPEISPDGECAERMDYSDVILKDRLRLAIAKINPDVPRKAREESIERLLMPSSQDLVLNNHEFHKLITNGIDVAYEKDGETYYEKVYPFDFDNLKNNDFLAVNQFTVIEGEHHRRPDVVLFVNGIPVVVMELKRPDNYTDDTDLIDDAYGQLETYKNDIPGLLRLNEILIISDGQEAKAGTITSNLNYFVPWKHDKDTKFSTEPEIDTIIKGMCPPETLMDMIRNFVLFEDDNGVLIKKLARYHQYYAVNKAVDRTKYAVSDEGDKRCGVVWHTTGAGKSIEMVFYTQKISREKNLENPTVVVITDRNDLDDQLFDTFSRCMDYLRQTPIQANDSKDLMDKLSRKSGGIIFTTLQKFSPDEDKYPLLSERRNIIVMADEAHRSQYGLGAKLNKKTGIKSYGFAKYLRDAIPNSSFIGFTGTPIKFTGRDTEDIFGTYIDIYDIAQSLEDNVTVPISYESRLSDLQILTGDLDIIDSKFEEITDGEDSERIDRLKSKETSVEAVLTTTENMAKIANDIVTHFEGRNVGMDGKGMIVTMSRSMAAQLHDAIVEIRPDWYDEDDSKGQIKVIITGKASETELQEHIRPKQKQKKIQQRMKDPEDPLKVVIVCDMWLTGFDVPCLTTMYFLKYLTGHNIIQAISRVNRVYLDKPGGLIVDYVGILYDLKQAIKTYTERGGKGLLIEDKQIAVNYMQEKYEQVSEMFYGFDYNRVFTVPAGEKLGIIREGADFILQKDILINQEVEQRKRPKEDKDYNRKQFIKFTTELSKAFALASPRPEIERIRDELGYFQSVKSVLISIERKKKGYRTTKELKTAVRQLVKDTVKAGEIIDVFDVMGMKKEKIDIFDEKFLEEIKNMPQKNLAFEVLQKLLNDQIKAYSRRNLTRSSLFSEKLEKSINAYRNKNITSIAVVEELIKLAHEIRQEGEREGDLGLNNEEVAFYDALAENGSAVDQLGNDQLKQIAHELVDVIHNNTGVDWTSRKTVKAKLRLKVKKLLKKYKYPPDQQKAAVELVLKQASASAEEFVSAC